jgi:hypothetical protein
VGFGGGEISGLNMSTEKPGMSGHFSAGLLGSLQRECEDVEPLGHWSSKPAKLKSTVFIMAVILMNRSCRIKHLTTTVYQAINIA